MERDREHPVAKRLILQQTRNQWWAGEAAARFVVAAADPDAVE